MPAVTCAELPYSGRTVLFMRRRGNLYFCGCLALAAAFFLALTPPACARRYYSWEKKPKKSFIVKTKVRRWQALTSAQVRTSALTPASWWTPAPPTPAVIKDVTIGGTMDFKVLATPLYLYSAEVQPFRGFTLEFETSDNHFTGGRYADHDWANATYRASGSVLWDSPSLSDYAAKTARNSGTARQYSAAAYLTVYRNAGRAQDYMREIPHSLDFFAAYSWYENKAHLTNGYQTLSNSLLPAPPEGPINGLNSRARMAWYGWRFGVREQADLGKGFSAEARFAYGPLMKYRGENYWNLDASMSNPGVRTNATGQLAEFSISASYKFWKKFEAEAGWISWAYKSASGSETRYYANGSTLAGDVTRVRSARKGAFLGLTWRY